MAEIARKHGYALAVHGSLQRDFDLIAVPWVENPNSPEEFIEEITSTFTIDEIGEPTLKPHGRVARTVVIGFGQCALDLSFMPTYP